MILEEQLEITYVEFGAGSSGDRYKVDRSATFFNVVTNRPEPVRWISCSNPRCNMNQDNSKYTNRGYSINSLVSKVIRTGEPIDGERINCKGRESRGGLSCDNSIEVTIEIKDVSQAECISFTNSITMDTLSALTITLTNHAYLDALNDAYCTTPIFDTGSRTQFLYQKEGFRV